MAAQAWRTVHVSVTGPESLELFGSHTNSTAGNDQYLPVGFSMSRSNLS